jgi:hypothetical protein
MNTPVVLLFQMNNYNLPEIMTFNSADPLIFLKLCVSKIISQIKFIYCNKPAKNSV